jgi:hypothetical protein
MEQSAELAELASCASHLLAMDLRSKAVVIARLLPLIERAAGYGYSHATIYQLLVASGMPIGFDVYKNALYRARQRPLAPAFVREASPCEQQP